MTPSKLVYRNTIYMVALGFFALFGTAIFIGQLFNPGKGGVALQAVAAISAGCCAALTGRCLVAPSILAAPNGARVRTLLQTRRYGWDEIEGFEVQERHVGLLAYRRKVLVIVLRNGKIDSISGLNARAEAFGWVDDAVLQLSSYVPAKTS